MFILAAKIIQSQGETTFEKLKLLCNLKIANIIDQLNKTFK